MKKLFLFFLIVAGIAAGLYAGEPLHVVFIGAHPDDCDIKAGGTAMRYARAGHKVLFVSLTNGDAGHHAKGGGALAHIRRAEAEEAGRRLGIEYLVLDNHDGELLPTLENRLELIRIIRRWNADLVFGHRPNDYHPDHRNASVLMQDAAYLVIVPNVASDVPPLTSNPVFLYMEDVFQKPNPFNPDVVVDISNLYEEKIYAIAAHESQMFEWIPWTNHQVDKVPVREEERLKWLAKIRRPVMTEAVRKSLVTWYGAEKASNISVAESFELCEYGRHPSGEELKELFPFLP